MSTLSFPSLNIRPFLTGNNKNLKTNVTAPLGDAKYLKSFPAPDNIQRNIVTGVAGCLKSFQTPAPDNIQRNIVTDFVKGVGDSGSSTMLSASGKIPDKLESIHSKLFAEAEKIQKWKISVEVDQQQKVKKLQDALRTIDSQGKDLLNLQLRNESISMQLADELMNRNEVVQKHQSTRELCVALKKHFIGLQDKIEYAERMKDHFEMVENQRDKAFENLAEKFDNLRLEHMEQVQTFNNIVSSRDREMENMRDAYNNELSEVNKQLQYLNALKESAEHEANQVRSQLKQKELFCENVSSDKERLTQEICNLKDINNKLGIQVKEANDQIYNIQAEKLKLEDGHASLEARACELQNMNDGLRDQLSESQKEYQQKTNMLEISLNEASKELHNYEKNIEKQTAIINHQESLANTIQEEKKILEQEIVILKKDVLNGTELMEKIRQLEEQLEYTMQERDDFAGGFEKSLECISEKENLFELLQTDMQNKERELLADVDAKIKKMEMEINSATVENEENIMKVEEELKSLFVEKDDIFCELQQTKSDLADKECLCESLQSDVHRKARKIANLVTEKDKLQIEISETSVQYEETIKKLDKELNDMCTEKDNISSEFETIKSRLSEQECLRESLELNIKTKEQEIIALKAEMDGLQLKIEEISMHKEDKQTEIQDELEGFKRVKRDLLSEVQRVNYLLSVKESHNTSFANEVSNKDKTISSLSGEIKNLKMQINGINSKKQISTGEIQVLKNQLKIANSQCDELKFLKEKLERKILEDEKEFNNACIQSKTKNAELEKKINDLFKQNENENKLHAKQLMELKSQIEKFKEMIALSEQNQKDSVHSIEKQNEAMSCSSEVQKPQNQSRSGGKRKFDENRLRKVEDTQIKASQEVMGPESNQKVSNRTVHNVRLQSLQEKKRAELEKKKFDENRLRKVEDTQIKASQEVMRPESNQKVSDRTVHNVRLQSLQEKKRAELEKKKFDENCLRKVKDTQIKASQEMMEPESNPKVSDRTVPNARLQSLQEKKRAELEKKVVPNVNPESLPEKKRAEREMKATDQKNLKTQNVKMNSLPEKRKAGRETKEGRKVFKMVGGTIKEADNNSVSSENSAIEIHYENIEYRSSLIYKPQEIGLGRGKLLTDSVSPQRRAMRGKGFTSRSNATNNKKVKLSGIVKSLAGGSSSSNIQERQNVANRKFFKTSRGSRNRTTGVGLNLFDVDPTYGFFG